MNTNKKHNIQNPEKWIGKYVRHMANWWDFAWGDDGYVVCEQTGKLFRIENEAYYGDYFETLEMAYEAGFDPCYYYSEVGMMDMYNKAAHKAA